MICLNKADEGTFRHLAYNQSPPALASNATTRQDLNGISNLREYVAASQDGVSGGSPGGMLGQAALDEKLHREVQPGNAAVLAPNAGRWPCGMSCFHVITGRSPINKHSVNHQFFCSHAVPSLRFKAVTGGDDQKRLVWVPSSRCLERLWSWTTWILSVLFFSYIFSALRVTNLGTTGSSSSSNKTMLAVPGVAGNSSLTSDSASSDAALTKMLHHVSKRSTCATGGVNKDEYNTGLHAAALFIIWFVSSLGCAFPIMAARLPGLRIPRRFFFAVRHFGTGVLIATAFVHLLPTAFKSLGNPCLGTFWTKDYEPMPGAIALAAIFLVSIIEMVFHPCRHVPPADIVTTRSPNKETTSGKAADSDGHPIRDMGPLRGRRSSLAQGLSQLNQAALADEISRQGQLDGSAVAKSTSIGIGVARSESEMGVLSPEQKRNKERLQCILLEMGILFHSVFIGMALSVSIGNDFIVLLIAIIFHRK